MDVQAEVDRLHRALAAIGRDRDAALG